MHSWVSGAVRCEQVNKRAWISTPPARLEQPMVGSAPASGLDARVLALILTQILELMIRFAWGGSKHSVTRAFVQAWRAMGCVCTAVSPNRLERNRLGTGDPPPAGRALRTRRTVNTACLKEPRTPASRKPLPLEWNNASHRPPWALSCRW